MRYVPVVVLFCFAAALADPVHFAPLPAPKAPPPRFYTKLESALAVQKFLKLMTPPVLSQPASLDPSAPYIAGLAELDFDSAHVNGGALQASTLNGDLPSIPPSAIIVFTKNWVGGINGYVRVRFRAAPGKRYAVDCRETSTTGPVQYQIGGEGFTTSYGTVLPSADGHVILATEGPAKLGTMDITLSQEPPNIMTVYGCQISLF